METTDKIRNATFTLTRRGYDRREVDSYLSKLADWLEGGGADQVHSDTIKHELDRIGRQTSKILTAAQESAESLRSDAQRKAREIAEEARISVESTRTAADEYAKQARAEVQGIAGKAREEAEARSKRIRSEAEAHSARVRQGAEAYATKSRDEADDYAKRVRSQADAHASEAVRSAEAKAIRMVEEGTRRRREIEKVIADLQTRREAVVKGLEKLSSQLAGAATEGMSADVTADAKRPSQLPPTNAKQPATDATPPAPTRQ